MKFKNNLPHLTNNSSSKNKFQTKVTHLTRHQDSDHIFAETEVKQRVKISSRRIRIYCPRMTFLFIVKHEYNFLLCFVRVLYLFVVALFSFSGGYLIFSFFDRLIKNDFSIIKAEPTCIFISKTTATTEQQQHCVHINRTKQRQN